MVSFVRKWKQLNLFVNRSANSTGSRSIWGRPTKTAKFNYTHICFWRNYLRANIRCKFPAEWPKCPPHMANEKQSIHSHLSLNDSTHKTQSSKIFTICCVKCQCQCVVMTLSFSLPFMSERCLWCVWLRCPRWHQTKSQIRNSRTDSHISNNEFDSWITLKHHKR